MTTAARPTSKEDDLAASTHRRRIVTFFGYWAVLFVATHWPSSIEPLEGQYFDKVAHFLAYGLLAWLAARAFGDHMARGGWRWLFYLWLAIAVYGAFDEWLQIPVGRSCEFYDWLADLFGAAVALIAFRYVSLSDQT